MKIKILRRGEIFISKRMNVQEPWFSYLVSGLKTVEGRKASATWLPLIQNYLQDPFIVLNNSEGKSARFQITDVRRYAPISPYVEGQDLSEYVLNVSSVRNYLENEGLDKALPGIETMEEGVNIYRGFSTDLELASTDFLAIEMRFINYI